MIREGEAGGYWQGSIAPPSRFFFNFQQKQPFYILINYIKWVNNSWTYSLESWTYRNVFIIIQEIHEDYPPHKKSITISEDKNDLWL